MNNNIKAFKSGVWYTFASFLTNAIGLITTPIFTRMLTKADFGAYSNFMSWLSIISLLSTLNLDRSFVRARFDFEKRFDEYIYSMLALSSLSVLFWVIVLNSSYAFASQYIKIDRIYLNSMLIYILLRVAVQMYQARERYYYRYRTSVLIGIVISLSTAILSVALTKAMDNKYAGRIIGFCTPMVVVGIILYYLIYKHGRRVNTHYFKYALPICIPFIPHLLSMTLLGSMDRIMITNLIGEESNALYTLAYNCGGVITIFLTSMNSAYVPWLGEKLHQRLYQEIQEFSKTYVLLFTYLAFGIMLLTPELLLLLGGKAYTESIGVMPPVTCGIVFQFIYTLFVNVEQYYKRTIGMAIGSVSAALMNYVLNSVFIPRYGYLAAAFTTLASYLWLLIIHMYLVYKMKCYKLYDYGFIFRIVLVCLISTMGFAFIYRSIIARCVFVCGYICFSLIYGIKNKQKVRSLVKLFLKK